MGGDRGSRPDIKNVMRVPSAACVKSEGWGKMLSLNIHFFVVYGLTVAVVYPVQRNSAGVVKVY